MRNAVLAVLSFFLLACATLLGPVSTATPPPSATPAATLSPSPEPTASYTPTASDTPEPTLTFTPVPSETLTPQPSLTPPPAGTLPPEPTKQTQLDCSLVMQSVANGTHFAPKERFSFGWKVTNSGTLVWEPNVVEFAYVAGARLDQSPVVRLQSAVSPGDSVTLTVDMRAPVDVGTYTTAWALRRGNEYFCRVRLTIYVEQP